VTAFPPVAELVPHEAPMCLIDEVLDAGDTHIVCGYTPLPGAPFAQPDGIEAVVALEYMAQTIAAFAGLEGRAQGEPPKIGYLLGCRQLTLHRARLALGVPLRIEVRRVFGDAALGNFACVVHDAQGPVAEAQLSVAQPGPGMALPGDA